MLRQSFVLDMANTHAQNHGYIYFSILTPKNGVSMTFFANARVRPGLVKGAAYGTKVEVRPPVIASASHQEFDLMDSANSVIYRDKAFFVRHSVFVLSAGRWANRQCHIQGQRNCCMTPKRRAFFVPRGKVMLYA